MARVSRSGGGLGILANRKAPSGTLLGGPAGASSALTLNRLCVGPAFIPAGTTINNVWWGLGTNAVSSFFRPVIYSADPSLLVPGALLLDVGQQDASVATGDKQVSITPITFPNDTLVFVGGVAQGVTCSVRLFSNTSGAAYYTPPWQFLPQNLSTAFTGFRKDGISGAPPASWGSPDWTNAAQYGSPPYLGLQVQ